MIKNIKYLVIVIALFFSFGISVNAKEINHTIDFSRKGSIEIILQEQLENTYVEGANITIYKIADGYANGAMYGLKYTEEFSSCDVSLDDLTKNNLVTELSKCVKEDTLGTTKATNELGNVKFNDLSLGLYLVKQTNKVKGYSVIDPYLVQLPKVIDNSWTYNITTNPKTEIYKEIDLKVVKVWNVKNNVIPSYIEIELYDGEELIDTVKLNEDNNWTYIWEDIEKSDKYSVKEINIPKGYTVSYSNNEYVFTVTNTDTLPDTGQLFYSIIITAILGVILLLIGVVDIKSGRNE